ncbi:MAG: IPTL-CTERM sorting domain-containing protein [Phycisphaerae bacterium]|jgi:hypothetical protein
MNASTPVACYDACRSGMYTSCRWCQGSECDGEDHCDGPACSDFDCTGAIPTVSEWGLAVMVLLLFTAGTVLVARRRRLIVGG